MVKACQPKTKGKCIKRMPLLSLPVARKKNFPRRSRSLSFTGTVPKIFDRKTCLGILANSRRKVIPVRPNMKAVLGKPVQPGKLNHDKPKFVTIKCTAHKNNPSLEFLLDNLKIEKSADTTPQIPIRKQDTMGGIPE